MRLIQLSDLMDIRLPLSSNCNRKWTQIDATHRNGTADERRYTLISPEAQNRESGG
jgi:hypothetical protein